MKTLNICILSALAFMLCTSCGDRSGRSESCDLKLWYEQPAARWLEALPLGNGRLGVVHYGGVSEEHLGLNESTLWSGAPNPLADKVGAADHLAEVRQLLFRERFAEAEALIEEWFFGNKDSYGTHLPLGEMYLRFPHQEEEALEYKRELDLEDGISSVRYMHKGIEYRRECFSSWPDQTIVLRLEAGEKGSLDFQVALDGGKLAHEVIARNSTSLDILGKAREKHHSQGRTGVDFHGRILVRETDGTCSTENGTINVNAATHATLLIAANTSYLGEDPQALTGQQLSRLRDMEYAQLKERHVKDHRALFSRVDLDLGSDEKVEEPTDQRLKAIGDDPDDPQLYALFYQFARYLIIASSREDSPLPNNLQGIWNDHLASKMQWTCDFHLDINMQQNYWPVENGNLSECHEPLFRMIEGFQEPGSHTAKTLYGANGWVAHVVTNAWGFTSPGWGLVWGLHVTGGTWITTHLWHHYEYTGDLDFLRERAYPVMKGNAEFFLDYLVEHPEYGWLVTGPAVSPENKFYGPDGLPHGESMGPTMDAVLIHELFGNVLRASEILEVDEDFRKQILDAREMLPPLRIGKYGQVMEWLEDYEEAVPEHRCISHLVSLFPGCRITPEKTPELAHAAKVSIQRRISHPEWEDVEWSIGNLVNWYARLGEADSAYLFLHELLHEHTDMDMFTFSRAGIAGAKNNIMVMDGNTSGASGISEMLVQSFDGKIFLLPALPDAWPDGHFKGVCTRGGFELDLHWKGGELEKLMVQSRLGSPLQLEYGGTSFSMNTEKKATYTFNAHLKQIQ